MGWWREKTRRCAEKGNSIGFGGQQGRLIQTTHSKLEGIWAHLSSRTTGDIGRKKNKIHLHEAAAS